MTISNVLAVNQVLLRPYLAHARCIIDATLGNGYDSAFVLRHAPHLQYLFCCDIQAQAMQSSQRKLAAIDTPAQIYRYEMNHAYVLEDFPLDVDVILFNLGYLPGGNHAVHTRAEDTLRACAAGLQALRRGGVLSVVSYPGTAAGAEEDRALQAWVQALPQQKWHVAHVRMPNQIHQPPCLFFIERR